MMSADNKANMTKNVRELRGGRGSDAGNKDVSVAESSSNQDHPPQQTTGRSRRDRTGSESPPGEEQRPQPFVCKYCQCRFPTLEICCQHVRTAHALPKYNENGTGVGGPGGGGGATAEKEVFPKPEYIAFLNRCRSCGMSFSKPSELTDHYVENHDPQFKTELAVRRKRAEKRRKENRKKEVYYCK